MSAELLDLSAAALAARVRAGQTAPLAAATAARERIAAVRAGPEFLNAIRHEDPAATSEPLGPDALLAGVPVALKSNFATLVMPTDCGSRILEGYVSPYESTVVRRLREAGAVIIAKTNMDEFAMGSSNEHSAFGPVRNPIDPERVPGGSSGGSAVAVAAGIVRIALGSETGGSVRQPASFCGIVGVKPTYGRVSRYGLVAFASSLDHVAVFGKEVDDAALGLQVIAGHDPRDSTSIDRAVPDYRLEAAKPLAGLVVGRPREYFPSSLDARVVELCDRALDTLRAQGAEIRDVTLPNTDLAIPIYYIIAPAEASSNLARFDGVRYGARRTGDGLDGLYEATRSHGFGPEVTRRILLGTYVLSAGYYDAYYKRAQEVRDLITRDFALAFASGVHVILTPTTPTPAFRLGAVSDPYEMYLNDIFTATANLAGVPAMSVPMGCIDGLPIGAQLIAAHFDEPAMFRAAYALERGLGAEAHR